jgi:hypothetical protein
MSSDFETVSKTRKPSHSPSSPVWSVVVEATPAVVVAAVVATALAPDASGAVPGACTVPGGNPSGESGGARKRRCPRDFELHPWLE